MTRSQAELTEFFLDVLADREAHPRDDFVTLLLTRGRAVSRYAPGR